MNREDVALVNSSITGLGNSFLAKQKEDAEEDYRQQLLDREIERQKTAQSHYDAMNQNERGANKIRAAAAADKDDQETFKQLTTLNASGALTKQSRDNVNAYLSSHPKWGKVGLALQEPTQKPPPQVGQSSVAQALKIAEENESAAESEDDPNKKAQLLGDAQILRDAARQQGMPKNSPNDFDTVTEETPGSPGKAAIPPTEGGIFSKGTPGSPAIPAVPKQIIRRHVPRGAISTTAPTSTALPTTTGTTTDPNMLRQQAQDAIAKGAPAASVKARFKQVTGQDL